jgi:hypothetical protein
MRKSKDHLTAVKTEPHGFFELAKAHVAGHGGEWFMVDKRQAPEQWRAWIAYFAWLDDQTMPRGHKLSTFRTLEKLTVPTAWPLEFDVSAPPAPPEPREEMPTLERRRELGARLSQLVAAWGAEPRHRGRDARDAAPAGGPKDYSRDPPPQVSTPGLANYLAEMRGGDETAMTAEEAWARAEGQSR